VLLDYQMYQFVTIRYDVTRYDTGMLNVC